VTDPALLAQYAAVLSPEETRRCQRLRFENDRHQFLVSHAWVRHVLSIYADLSPAAWTFTLNAHGRPDIAESVTDLPLRFNLTHTKGLAACLVSLDAACGIDAETLSLPANASGIARKMFAANEQRALASLQGAAYVSRFFGYWTLREAYCKAVGLGLSAPMETFAFEYEETLPIRIRFSADTPDTTRDWQFGLVHLLPTHLLAMALSPDRPGAEKQIRLLPYAAGDSTDVTLSGFKASVILADNTSSVFTFPDTPFFD